MTDPIRAALERLIARLDETTDPSGPVPAWSDSFYAARAALSADGPAVPEGREPSDVDVLRAAAHALGYLSTPSWDFEAVPMSADDVLTIARAAIALDRSHRATAPPAEREPASVVGEPSDAELLATLDKATADFPPRHPEAESLNAMEYTLALELRKARAILARYGHQPAPPAEVAPGPSMEDVGPLIAWLTERACQAADASQPTDAGMLTWAAQVIGERVNEDAPDPPAEGEVGELVDSLRRASDGASAMGWEQDSWIIARAADLLEQRHPAPVPVSERLPGDELCWWFEADEDCGYGSNWTLLRIRGSATGYTHWLPATALPLPAGEVEP